jgi:hypothetical protein
MNPRRVLIQSPIPIAMALACLLCGGSAAATPTEYDRAVASAAARIESALSQERAHPGAARQALDDLSRSIPSAVVTEDADGSRIRADLSRLKSDISSARRLKGKKQAERLGDVLARLRTLEDAARVRRPGSNVSSDRARGILAGTLAGKEYQESLKETVIQRALGAILSALDRVLGPGTGEVISWVMLVGLVLGAAAVLAFLVFHLIHSRSPKRQRAVPTTLRQVGVERPTAEALLQQAESDARSGRFREAFRSIYLAAILHLDGRRFVTYAEGTTNWEYTRSARQLAPPDIASLFRDMTIRFDDLIYGQQTVTGDEYSGFRRSYHELEETA